MPAGLLGHAMISALLSTPICEKHKSRRQSPFATDLFLSGEVPVVNKP
jgi:hypothetical protein